MASVPPEIAQQLAAATLNWGAAENYIGNILAQLYGLDHDQAKDLVYPLNLSRKAYLLEKNLSSGRIASELKPLVEAISYSVNNFRKYRNIFSHGILSEGWDGTEPGILTFDKPSVIRASQFDIVVDQSRYVHAAVLNLLLSMRSETAHLELPLRPAILSDPK